MVFSLSRDKLGEEKGEEKAVPERKKERKAIEDGEC